MLLKLLVAFVIIETAFNDHAGCQLLLVVLLLRVKIVVFLFNN
jgi:hypothetical protein